jgi:TRAP-type mannitol/chloroaromatic compound transport system permease small subunit
MTALLSLSSKIDWLNQKFGLIASWSVFVACMISAANALSRYAFNISSNGWLEIQWYLFSAMFLLGAAYTLKLNEHVRVDVVYMSIGDRGRLLVDAIGFVLFFFPVVLVMLWLSWPFFVESYVSNETSTSPGGLIRWPVKLMLPLGFLLLLLQGISEFIKRIAALKGIITMDSRYEKPLQ